MAEAEYEQLETFLQSDLQSLDQQNKEAGGADITLTHLPEWLIGVIVVVILLIIAFFAMVIYSLLKERKRARAGSYGATAAAGPSMTETVEAGNKADGNIRITAFSLDQQPGDTAANGQAGTTGGVNGGTTWTLDAEVVSTLQRRQHGPSGCRNPAFIDDDDVENDDHNDDDGKASPDTKHTQNGKVIISDKETGENNDDDDNEKRKPESKQNGQVIVSDKENKDDGKKANSGVKENGKVVNDKDSQGGKETSKTKPDPTLDDQTLNLSPKPSNKSDSPKTTNGVEEVEMVECPSGRGEIGKEKEEDEEETNDATQSSDAADQETAVDEMDERDSSAEVKGVEKAKEHQTGGESAPEESSSSGGSQKLEVVMNTDRSSSPGPQACVMLHIDGQGNTELEKEVDFSTDERGEGPGTSTNL
ncbi:uncharacterized protein LOC143280449 [Babylonia areolata]|uniref:uncharacterized protein LOC143280449 n=1 Tax=Babylonia areolata TaxID=304850 RepID=UPI003FD566AE